MNKIKNFKRKPRIRGYAAKINLIEVSLRVAMVVMFISVMTTAVYSYSQFFHWITPYLTRTYMSLEATRNGQAIWIMAVVIIAANVVALLWFGAVYIAYGKLWKLLLSRTPLSFDSHAYSTERGVKC